MAAIEFQLTIKASYNSNNPQKYQIHRTHVKVTRNNSDVLFDDDLGPVYEVTNFLSGCTKEWTFEVGDHPGFSPCCIEFNGTKYCWC